MAACRRRGPRHRPRRPPRASARAAPCLRTPAAARTRALRRSCRRGGSCSGPDIQGRPVSVCLDLGRRQRRVVRSAADSDCGSFMAHTPTPQQRTYPTHNLPAQQCQPRGPPDAPTHCPWPRLTRRTVLRAPASDSRGFGRQAAWTGPKQALLAHDDPNQRRGS